MVLMSKIAQRYFFVNIDDLEILFKCNNQPDRVI